MLTFGLFSADLCYLRPEEPNQQYMQPVPLPPVGYNWDQCSASAVITRMTVKDGRLVLPDGMSYRVLVLPPWKFATVELLEKIRELVRGGAMVWGMAPETFPGFSHLAENRRGFEELKAELWSGPGRRVQDEGPLDAVLERMDCPPDFLGSLPLNWTARQQGATRVYFVANPEDNELKVQLTFRVKGMQPEEWNPETGEIKPIAGWRETGNSTKFVWTFNASGSSFFVFRSQARAPKASLPVTTTQAPSPLSVPGPWRISFPAGKGAPASAEMPALRSWTEMQDEGIRHFSGTANYAGKLTVPAEWPGADMRIFLELGEVQVMARVRLNGQDLGVLWRPPYRVEVTGRLQTGENILSIDVVNLWPNRMIADAGLPPEKRISWSDWEPFTPDMPLLPSGLIGPVRFVAELNT
jgi:hypothetical protein